MSAINLLDWVSDNEKYAIVALHVNIDGHIAPGELAPNLLVLADATFAIPAHWQEWLGRICVDEIKAANLFLLTRQRSGAPGVIDAESYELKQLVWRFYVGLLLASTFAPAQRPVIISGSRQAGEIDIRQQQDLDTPIPFVFRPYPPISAKDVRLAAELGRNFGAVPKSLLPGGHWRLFKTLNVYIEARTRPDILERLHQYCRCIDGLILPDAGSTKSQFKSKTEVFIGPRYHEMMGELYDIRSAVEHLHENRYLEDYDRTIRLDIVRKEAIAEHIARTALAKILATTKLWPHFANTSALATFWALPVAERQKIWGSPIDPMAALADFHAEHIHDGLLGRN